MTWLLSPLEKYLKRITYGFTNPMPTTENGPFMVTARDVNHGRILYEQARRTSQEAFDSLLTDKSRPQIGDVLVTKDGTLGRIAVVDRAGVCINQSVALLQPADAIRSRFLHYLLEAPQNFERMLGDADGTTIKHIYITRLARMEVAVPGLDVQDWVVGILGTLDDKIELNRKMAATLEEMARALYRSWFVDFDPVRARAEGRVPAHMDPTTANIFPDSFGEDGLPAGWKLGTVDQLFILQRGFDLPASARTDGPYAVLAAGGQHGSHSEFRVKGPGVTTGRSGVIGQVFLTLKDFWPLNTSLWVKEFRTGSVYFTYFFLEGLDLQALNSGSAVPSLNRNNVHNLSAYLPPRKITQAFDQFAHPIYKKIEQLKQASQILDTLRNTLLPRLMSGELHPGAVQDLIEEVA